MEDIIQDSVHYFLNANIGIAFERTRSFETIKYIRLIRQIVKLRLETGCLTRTDWINKQIIVRRKKKLDERQLKTMLWIFNNWEEVETDIGYRINILYNRYSKKI